ncbi:MAG: tRNA guanosine(34) transglycosylase Tgt [Patescibacteria group bacterium]
MFKVLKQSKISQARLGKITTAHGEIETPFFMPDATRGVVKSLGNEDLKNLGLEAAVINTYHLYLQPGMELISKARGAHNFMNWDKPLLSDSGGYQVYSLLHKNKNMGKILDDKAIFKSPLDGSQHELTPERSIQIQFILGADMIVCLDDCPPHDAAGAEMKKSVERTIAWAKRCKIEYDRLVRTRRGAFPQKKPLLFAVIQGGTDLAMRQKCADALVALGFNGYGFGARPVDTDGKFLGKVLQETADMIPESSLRFGLGIGLPEDIVRCVKMGWDMFDCVIPTREGRHGRIFTSPSNPLSLVRRGGGAKRRGRGVLNINNAKFAKDFKPINEKSKLPELREYSRAYLHHLFKINEPLGQRLASLNNLEFYLELMEKIRISIKKSEL